ncbi:hypothetical protein IQ63_01565 [Streptomyces acidiscabies]|uniref:Uncharacterized protein n=1 Tax=Streptomyces acidiscabies TaxID=42234 RepID=A0A0L0KPU2_9ACTN|nr:hypothetical protein IQ63_01565 [Streptomyces acidiscabies]
MEQLTSDGCLQLAELHGEPAGCGCEIVGGGLERGEGHVDLEATEAKPAVQGAFHCRSDVVWHGFIQFRVERCHAACAEWASGDAEILKVPNDDVAAGANLLGDVVDAAGAVEVLLAEPFPVLDGVRTLSAENRDAEASGVLDYALRRDPVILGDHVEWRLAFCVLALQEIGGQDGASSLLQAPCAERCSGVGDLGKCLLPGISSCVAHGPQI